MKPSALSARPNAFDRLRSLYASPGPFVSLYLSCGEFSDKDPVKVFESERRHLAEQGATEEALDAVAARLGLPVPNDVGGWSIHAAADGSTAVDFAPEGPAAPILTVGALPMAAPLIEWDQWRVPHVAVTFGASTAEVVSFVPGSELALTPLPVDPTSAAAVLRDYAAAEDLRLIAIAGAGGDTGALADRLRGIVPPRTNVVELDAPASGAVDTLANETVRFVADVVARDTVRALEDFRFLLSSGSAVEGSANAFDALAAGRALQLLIHDDPNDPTAASFGATPTQVSAELGRFPQVARRADVAIWSAVSQGIDIRIIPTTSSTGPDENIGVTLAAEVVEPS